MLDDIHYNPEQHNLLENPSFHLRTPAWIKIEEEQFTPFYEYLEHKVRGVFILDSCSPANLALLKQQARFAHDRALDQAFAVMRDIVSVQMVGEDGTILFDLDFDQARRQWSLATDHVCPYGECVSTGLSLRRCWRCDAALDLFSRWVPICMLALSGWFRQIEVEESAPAPPSSLPRTPGPGEQHRPLTRVVRTIDVSVRSVRRSDDEEERSSSHASRGSWVERARAQDPDLVKDEERQVPERKRTLKHPRYRNYIEKHGNKVTVKAHTRTVHLLNLPRTTRARAKRYGDLDQQ